jgi:hypothetical protein
VIFELVPLSTLMSHLLFCTGADALDQAGQPLGEQAASMSVERAERPLR